MTQGRCSAVIALRSSSVVPKEEEHSKSGDGNKGQPTVQGLPGKSVVVRQVQVQAGKSSQWVGVRSGSVGYMARHGQGPLTGTKGKGRGLKAASEQGGYNHPPSSSSFSHNSFLNSLNPDYAAALCLH